MIHDYELEKARTLAVGADEEVVSVSKRWLKAVVAEIDEHRGLGAAARHETIMSAIDQAIAA